MLCRICVLSRGPTQEVCARSCRLNGSDPATWAGSYRSYRSYRSGIYLAWKICIKKWQSMVCPRCANSSFTLSGPRCSSVPGSNYDVVCHRYSDTATGTILVRVSFYQGQQPKTTTIPGPFGVKNGYGLEKKSKTYLTSCAIGQRQQTNRTRFWLL